MAHPPPTRNNAHQKRACKDLLQANFTLFQHQKALPHFYYFSQVEETLAV